jgi:hypothetical protein
LWHRVSRLVVTGTVMVMPGSTVIWSVSDSTVTLGGLASVREADLDPLAADHDRPVHRKPAGSPTASRASTAAAQFPGGLRAAGTGLDAVRDRR